MPSLPSPLISAFPRAVYVPAAPHPCTHVLTVPAHACIYGTLCHKYNVPMPYRHWSTTYRTGTCMAHAGAAVLWLPKAACHGAMALARSGVPHAGTCTSSSSSSRGADTVTDTGKTGPDGVTSGEPESRKDKLCRARLSMGRRGEGAADTLERAPRCPQSDLSQTRASPRAAPAGAAAHPLLQPPAFMYIKTRLLIDWRLQAASLCSTPACSTLRCIVPQCVLTHGVTWRHPPSAAAPRRSKLCRSWARCRRPGRWCAA